MKKLRIRLLYHGGAALLGAALLVAAVWIWSRI